MEKIDRPLHQSRFQQKQLLVKLKSSLCPAFYWLTEFHSVLKFSPQVLKNQNETFL